MWRDAVGVTDILKRSRRPLLSFFLPFPSSRNNLFPCFPHRRILVHSTQLSCTCPILVAHRPLAAHHPCPCPVLIARQPLAARRPFPCPVPAAHRLLAAVLVLPTSSLSCYPKPSQPSRYTHHISPNLTGHQEYHPLEQFLEVASADSVSLVIGAGRINLQLTCRIILRVEVLYIPDFGTSLLSMPQPNEDGYDVILCSRTATAFITSDTLTEQPLRRHPAGLLSYNLLGSSIRAQSHIGNAYSRCQSDSADSNKSPPASLNWNLAPGASVPCRGMILGTADATPRVASVVTSVASRVCGTWHMAALGAFVDRQSHTSASGGPLL